MTEPKNRTTRRQFLKGAGLGAAGVMAAGGGFVAAARAVQPPNPPPLDPTFSEAARMALAATDGHILLPHRPGASTPPYYLDGKPLYIFGFIHVPAPPDAGSSISALESQYKTQAQHVAPILGFKQETDIRITLSNLGLVARPDLADSHTIHWHGFRAPSSMFDGVPEVSIAVGELRQFTYFYRPHDPGTYMYHCHFEDVEHVQMGMTSIVFVTPIQDGSSVGGFTRFAYNDGDGSTGYHRQFAILLNEIWTTVHDNDELIQESIHTDYDPNYFTLNGRCYPQTTWPSDSPTLPDELRLLNSDGRPTQPISSLIQCNGGERILLRLANLGYQQHAMQLPGIRMRVVGEDARILRSSGGANLYYDTNTIYMGPGEARDVLFTAPSFNPARRSGSDTLGTYNAYFFKNRSARKLSNDGHSGPGGMMTEVRVYDPTTVVVPQQHQPNETYQNV